MKTDTSKLGEDALPRTKQLAGGERDTPTHHSSEEDPVTARRIGIYTGAQLFQWQLQDTLEISNGILRWNLLLILSVMSFPAAFTRAEMWALAVATLVLYCFVKYSVEPLLKNSSFQSQYLGWLTVFFFQLSTHYFVTVGWFFAFCDQVETFPENSYLRTFALVAILIFVIRFVRIIFFAFFNMTMCHKLVNLEDNRRGLFLVAIGTFTLEKLHHVVHDLLELKREDFLEDTWSRVLIKSLRSRSSNVHIWPLRKSIEPDDSPV